MEQYIRLYGIPKIIRTGKVTAFTGRLFREFCKRHYVKLIYRTPYIHTPTGLVERVVRTLKENPLTNFKTGELFRKALDMSLEVMRKIPHTRLRKSAFEPHYGRKPNTEIINLSKLDMLEKLTKGSVLAKPDTLQVYSFNGAGGVSNQLPMKPKKSAKGVINYPSLFLEKKISDLSSKVLIPINPNRPPPPPTTSVRILQQQKIPVLIIDVSHGIIKLVRKRQC